MTITIDNLLMLIAVLLAPLIAVQITDLINIRRDARERKMQIFRTLMGSRANALSPEHVHALNLIDVEFYDKKGTYEAVVLAWRAYHDVLGDRSLEINLWTARKNDLLVELLFQMSQSLGYNLNRIDIKNTSYFPVMYGDKDREEQIIRRGFASIFSGQFAFPVNFIPPNKQDNVIHNEESEPKKANA